MRRLFVRLHLWLGLALGLIWAVQGLTGSLLVVHRELDRMALPQLEAAPMVPLATVIANAANGGGGAQPVERIGIADATGQLLLVEFRDGADGRQGALIEAATGRVLGTRDADPASPFTGSASRWLYTLHEALLLGERGEVLVGVSGAFLMSAIGMGLWIGWPRRAAWRAALRPRLWRTTRQRLYGWHRLVGIGAGLVMLVTLPCGIYMIFAAELRPMIARSVPHQLAYKPASDPSFVTARIAPDQALASAHARFPDAAFVRIAMPSAASPAYMIRLRQPGETRAWSGVTAVWVDARTGGIAAVYDPLRAPLSNRIADAVFSIHNGEVGRTFGRLLVFLAGLSLPALYITGLWSWWRKRRMRTAPPVAASNWSGRAPRPA